MKRYASHFLFIPSYGYLKQYVVETEKGRVRHIFPLTQEVEDTEWLPGVIVLVNSSTEVASVCFEATVLQTVPLELEKNLLDLTSYLFFPFDFTTMQPVAGTQHKLLQ